MDKLYTQAELEKQSDGYIAIASTEVQDRQGESIQVDGWDLKNFKKNPVLLLFHDHHSLPVGKAEKIWVEKSASQKKLMFKPVFETVTERGRAIAELVKQGFIRTFSVGFVPIDSDGSTYTKQELLEISLVNVPANPEAMMMAYKSLKGLGYEDKTITEVGIPAIVMDRIGKAEDRLSAVEQLAESAVKGLKYLNPPQRSNQRNVNTDRQLLTKVIDKAATSLLQGNLTEHKLDATSKLIKRTSELLILSHKEETNGKN